MHVYIYIYIYIYTYTYIYIYIIAAEVWAEREDAETPIGPSRPRRAAPQRSSERGRRGRHSRGSLQSSCFSTEGLFGCQSVNICQHLLILRAFFPNVSKFITSAAKERSHIVHAFGRQDSGRQGPRTRRQGARRPKSATVQVSPPGETPLKGAPRQRQRGFLNPQALGTRI